MRLAHIKMDRAKGASDLRHLLSKPHAKIALICLTLIATLHMLVLPLTDFYISSGDWLTGLLLSAWVLLGGIVALGYGLERTGLAMLAFAVPMVVGLLVSGGLLYLGAISVPFVDPWLHAADKSIGFDFRWLSQVYADNPAIMNISRFAYSSLAIQTIVIPVMMAVTLPPKRLLHFIAAYSLTLTITVAVFPLFPAEGPYAYYNIPLERAPYLDRLFPWETGIKIEKLRLGYLRDVTSKAAGLVSFPSFHAASAILLGWASLPWLWARGPILLLNAVMLFSTIVCGAHYLVDLIGGVVLAAGVIYWTGRCCQPNAISPHST